MDIATNLRSIDVKSASVNGRRICSILAIICLLHKLNSLQKCGIKSDEVSLLFSMLCLKPDVSKSPFSCADLKFLLGYLRDSNMLVISAISYLLPHIGHLSGINWVYAILLIHVLGKVEPFQPPAMDSSKIKWTDEYMRKADIKPTAAIAIFK